MRKLLSERLNLRRRVSITPRDLMCERILVPLDDSATARRGLQETIRLAQMTRGVGADRKMSHLCG